MLPTYIVTTEVAPLIAISLHTFEDSHAVHHSQNLASFLKPNIKCVICCIISQISKSLTEIIYITHLVYVCDSIIIALYHFKSISLYQYEVKPRVHNIYISHIVIHRQVVVC